MNKDGSISINQTFHGYENGHSLVASSMELPSDVKVKMLPITDMSGNSILEGFEEYITGYPIKEINAFAIGKTWYASEMKRPGCVWTHTLLISFVDVPLINDFESIYKLFVRPSSVDDADVYRAQITVHVKRQPKISDEISEGDFSPSVIKSIIGDLYNTDDRTILVRAARTNNFDKLLLSFWLQQWPRLKRNFTFCSGAIEPRVLDKRYLNLQIVPYRTFRESSSFMILDSGAPKKNQDDKHAPWVNLIYEDLKSPTLLRFFLATYGADVSPSRISFRKLVECFIYFSDSNRKLEESVSFISEQFESSNEAFNLKSNLLQPSIKDSNYFLPKYENSEVLFFLATTTLHSSLDYSKLKFEERFLNFFSEHPSKAVDLLNSILEADPNIYGENLFRLISTEIDSERLSEVLNQSSNLLSVLIGLTPKLTYSREFWRKHSDNILEILKILQRADDGHVNWATTINLLLDNQARVDPRIFDEYETHVVGIILDWINQNNDVSIDRTWTDYVENNPERVIAWLLQTKYPSPRSSTLVINFLNPNSKAVVSEGADPWLPAIESAMASNNSSLRSNLAAFCLPLAFNLSSTDAVALFRFSFEAVYHDLERNRLPFRFWNFLEVHTKPLSIFKDWDKCKKIVNALVDHAIRHGYDIRTVTSSILDENIISRILKRFNRVN